MATFLTLPPEVHIRIIDHHISNINEAERFKFFHYKYNDERTYKATIKNSLEANLKPIFALLPSSLGELMPGTDILAAWVAFQFAIATARRLKESFSMIGIEAAMFSAERNSLWIDKRSYSAVLEAPLGGRLSEILETLVEAVEHARAARKLSDSAVVWFWTCVLDVWKDDERYPVRVQSLPKEIHRFRYLLYIFETVLNRRGLCSRVPWGKVSEVKQKFDFESGLLEIARSRDQVALSTFLLERSRE
ncbi:hypothetical protein BJ508DRAFT_411899 [Ascobolus immersus RN42]|uniref:Uncharacterized protein n=1 Tax=Ascobolus immersus RN42 TaxID=1160509 RepID=A0A3N4IJ81_ASCIM|nr:hypothetical protein BJ508DRAFT_411899 [Ascobolus immersus RN42]